MLNLILIFDLFLFIFFNSLLISEIFSFFFKVVGVGCGNNHSLLVDKGGWVWAFGEGGSGQLGTGEIKSEISPVFFFFVFFLKLFLFTHFIMTHHPHTTTHNNTQQHTTHNTGKIILKKCFLCLCWDRTFGCHK